MKTSYKEMLGKTIETVLENGNCGLEEILVLVMESLMESERTSFLKYSRGETPLEENKRNGYYERFLDHMSGKFTLKIPRDRQGLFKPLALEIMKQDADKRNELALKLYGHGLSQRGISAVFEDIFGSSYSAQRVSDLVQEFQKEREAWQIRTLETKYHAILVDAVHINIRRDTVEKEAIYVVMGLKEDFTREIMGIYNLPQESASGWKDVFADLRKRGVNHASLFICDECSGIEKGIQCEFPNSFIQFCMVHKTRNLQKTVRSSKKAEIADDFRDLQDIDNPNHTTELFEENLKIFIEKWGKTYPSIKNMFPEHKIKYFSSYLKFPVTIRRMLYTTNWIERFNKEIRKVTKHTNSFPNPQSALNLVFMVAQNMSKTYSYPINNFKASENNMIKLLNSQTQFS